MAHLTDTGYGPRIPTKPKSTGIKDEKQPNIKLPRTQEEWEELNRRLTTIGSNYDALIRALLPQQDKRKSIPTKGTTKETGNPAITPAGMGVPSLYLANEDQRQTDQQKRQAILDAAVRAWYVENPNMGFGLPSVDKMAAMASARNTPSGEQAPSNQKPKADDLGPALNRILSDRNTPDEVPSPSNQKLTVDDLGPVLGRILSAETGIANGSAGWAIDLQNMMNQNNPNASKDLQPYYDMKDALQKKYPGAFLAGDLAGMVASGYLYGPAAKTEEALAAASRKVAPEALETFAGRQFGKQVFRGASVEERAAADEAAARVLALQESQGAADLFKEAKALELASPEFRTANNPLQAALNKVKAESGGLAQQAERGYTTGVDAGKDIRTLSPEEAEEHAFRAIKGPDSADSVILGKYEKGSKNSYDMQAKNYGSQYFNLDNWTELDEHYTKDDIWRINEKFLDIQMSSGRDIYLSHRPSDYIDESSFYSRELRYLLDNKYRFVEEGGLWRATR